MKCYKGTILSVDRDNSVLKYLIEGGGKVIYTGSELPQEYKSAELVDLDNKALSPASIDTLQHFASFSTFNAGLILSGRLYESARTPLLSCIWKGITSNAKY